jgi:hypothetical protein
LRYGSRPTPSHHPCGGESTPGVKMRKRKMAERLMQAELLAAEVNAYRREHDHPMRDGNKLKLDYAAMLRALHNWDAGREMKGSE